MTLHLPHFQSTLDSLQSLDTKYDNQTNAIEEWVKNHRHSITRNRNLAMGADEGSQVQVLHIFLTDFLMSFVKGERGKMLRNSIERNIRSFSDINSGQIKKIIQESSYRWGLGKGQPLIEEIVRIWTEKYQRNWGKYVLDAEAGFENNFSADPFLKIKGIGFKVRDLALSNFSVQYIANDLHIVRVSTRLGLLNYGFDLVGPKVEMGNNPGNDNHYRFLNRLFKKLSGSTNGKYLPVDIDKTFWHFGRTICDNKPKCEVCPVRGECMTGREKG